MRDIKNNIFSEKKYLLKKKKKEKEVKRIQKELKKRYKKEEERRKILNKKTSNVKNNNKKDIKIPTLNELEIIFKKITDEYDKKIKKTKKLHNNLIFLGLTSSGFKEITGESENQRTRRIKKIKKIHSKLIKTLNKNKILEKKIEIIHKKINDKLDILRK